MFDQGRQAPAPSQVPSFEQSPAAALLATQRPLGSAPPVPTGKQVPTFPATLQLLHRPVLTSSLQAESQHTPSVQCPLTQRVPAVQAAPGGSKPHELFTQVLGGRQSASDAQVDLQLPPLQTKEPQGASLGVVQFPAPSQAEAGVW